MQSSGLAICDLATRGTCDSAGLSTNTIQNTQHRDYRRKYRIRPIKGLRSIPIRKEEPLIHRLSFGRPRLSSSSSPSRDARQTIKALQSRSHSSDRLNPIFDIPHCDARAPIAAWQQSEVHISHGLTLHFLIPYTRRTHDHRGFSTVERAHLIWTDSLPWTFLPHNTNKKC